MRILISLLLLVCISRYSLAQTPADKTVKPVKTQAPSKTEIQSQMAAATNEIKKELADLEKQIASSSDEKEIKDLKEQADILKKQLAMMDGLNKNMAGMSENVVKEAANEESAAIIPKRDVTRINMIPQKTLTDAELMLFVRNVHSGVEKLISPTERSEALNIYSETKSKYGSNAAVANAANGCWMLGNWEKALFIMGKVCIDDISDADNLNNYASFLISTGAEQAAIPILEYLNSKYPNNSTIKNNIGQAWFGLGDLENAKKNLEETTGLYPNHSTANSTLANIYEAEGDKEKSISLLKASIKENYDPDKEAHLERLGGKLTYADMPEFNYPMQKDPFGINAMIQSLPENYPSAIGQDQKVDEINGYVNGVSKFEEDLKAEMAELDEKIKDATIKLATNDAHKQEFIPPYNSPAYKTAARSLQLIMAERFGSTSPLIIHLLYPSYKGSAANSGVITEAEFWQKCTDIWENEVAKPLADLAYAMRARVAPTSATCAEIDAATNAYMAKEAAIKKAGTIKIKQFVQQNSVAFDKWIKLNVYGLQDDLPRTPGQKLTELVSQTDFTVRRKRYKDGQVYNFLTKANTIVENQKYVKSACDYGEQLARESSPDDLTPLVPMKVKCDFIKDITLPVVTWSLECNIIRERPKGNMKKKNDPVSRGEGHSSTRRNGSRAPLGGRGPSNFAEYGESLNENQKLAPLNAEDKDPSQFSIEYDRWGNLVGFNFQLNEDGSALKDPDSVESGVDSRWSWNAIASPKKGFMNKLLIK